MQFHFDFALAFCHIKSTWFSVNYHQQRHRLFSPTVVLPESAGQSGQLSIMQQQQQQQIASPSSMCVNNSAVSTSNPVPASSVTHPVASTPMLMDNCSNISSPYSQPESISKTRTSANSEQLSSYAASSSLIPPTLAVPDRPPLRGSPASAAPPTTTGGGKKGKKTAKNVAVTGLPQQPKPSRAKKSQKAENVGFCALYCSCEVEIALYFRIGCLSPMT